MIKNAKSLNIKIGASLACANQINLSKDLELLIKGGIDFIHIDVMDGVYVNNYCFGTQIFHYLKEYKDIEVEVHLMTENPYDKINILQHEYFDKISFHIETCKNPIQTISKIKKLGKSCGIALNAATPEESITYLYEYSDYFLVMCVEAGFVSQEFIRSSINKVRQIRNRLNKLNMAKDIYVDGHIDSTTSLELLKVGANAFVGGTSSIFKKNQTVDKNLSFFKHNLLSKINN